MDKRRSLLVATDCSYHGTFNVAKLVAAGLRDTFDVTLALPKDANAAASLPELRRLGLSVLETAATFEHVERSTYDRIEAARILRTSAPDLILSCDGAQLFSLLALKEEAHARGIPVVTIVNSLTRDAFDQFAFLADAAKRALSYATTIVFVSKALRDRFEAALPLPKRKVVIPNFCTDAFFAEGAPSVRARMRRDLGIPDDALVCCTIGRIERNKGQHLSLAALRDLVAQGERRCCWLYIGRMEAWEREAFETALAASDAADLVRVLGERNDVRDLLDASDVLALTSYTEGMPLVVIEGLARGLAIVATAIDGVVEQIDETCGIFLPPPEGRELATIDALRHALEYLLADPVRLGEMRRAAKARSEAFRSQKAITAYRSELLAVARPASPETVPSDENADLATGVSLDMTNPAVAWNHLGTGWGRCASDGTPSEGERSEIRLRFAGNERWVRVALVLASHDGGKGHVTDVIVDGRPVATWTIGRTWRTYAIRLDLATYGSGISLHLHHRRTNEWGRALRIDRFDLERSRASLVARIAAFIGGTPKGGRA